MIFRDVWNEWRKLNKKKLIYFNVECSYWKDGKEKCINVNGDDVGFFYWVMVLFCDENFYL